MLLLFLFVLWAAVRKGLWYISRKAIPFIHFTCIEEKLRASIRIQSGRLSGFIGYLCYGILKLKALTPIYIYNVKYLMSPLFRLETSASLLLPVYVWTALRAIISQPLLVFNYCLLVFFGHIDSYAWFSTPWHPRHIFICPAPYIILTHDLIQHPDWGP